MTNEMTQEEVEEFVKEYYPKDTLIFIRKFNVAFDVRAFWLTIWKLGEYNEYYYPDIFCFNGKKLEKRFSLFFIQNENEESHSCLKYTEILNKQIGKFMLNNKYIFCYDFNHDGIDECISILQDTHNIMYIVSIDILKLRFRRLFNISTALLKEIQFEFILFNGRQGIKIYRYNYEIEKNECRFYYYDRIQQKYVQDESATSEELEQIHGSPDFFAEAGIDYTKLERLLVPSDLEGFSKPALRIWRNAVYARHGRTFKSEDLQALFNEYAWYKPDEEYSDEKLSDIDRANIKLIQMHEKKQR